MSLAYNGSTAVRHEASNSRIVALFINLMRCNPAAVSWIAADNRLRYLPALSFFLIIAQSLRAKRANTLVVKTLNHPQGPYTMPQGVIVQDLRVLSLSCRFQHRQRRAVRAHTQSKYCLLRRRLFRLHVRIAAGRAGRGDDLEPTASGWRHLHLRIYARRGTNDPLRLREPFA